MCHHVNGPVRGGPLTGSQLFTHSGANMVEKEIQRESLLILQIVWFIDEHPNLLSFFLHIEEPLQWLFQQGSKKRVFGLYMTKLVLRQVLASNPH